VYSIGGGISISARRLGHSEEQISTSALVILFVHIHIQYSRIYISGTKLGIVALVLYLLTYLTMSV
jgi:hypothetical protein